MSNSAINAFLKSAEEPLANRFIIATVPHISMVLDTIRSRCITIPFSTLNKEEMQKFAEENGIFTDDKKLQSIMIDMAMGKP
jgi:DNA polymerase-3 subunit delta'